MSNAIVQALKDPALAGVVSSLRDYRADRQPFDKLLGPALENVRQQAVCAGRQDLASAAWVCATIAAAQDHFVAAFNLTREDKYYGAWCALERAEVALGSLARHFTVADDAFGISRIRAKVPQFQSLYPYRVFASPGLIKKRILCSICEVPITPRSRCGHKRFELYDGKMCGTIIAESVALEMSMVTNPKQKYSVVFPVGQKFNYALVAYVSRALSGPWDEWSFTEGTRRREDARFLSPPFRELGRNEACACGSGKKFKKCCLPERYYNAPHYEFSFEKTPPAALHGLLEDMVCHGVDDMG